MKSEEDIINRIIDLRKDLKDIDTRGDCINDHVNLTMTESTKYIIANIISELDWVLGNDKKGIDFYLEMK